MEIRQLKYFIAAAKCLNFTTAAEQCFIVQSAMSQQIASLERELGVSLFTRGSRSLSLTPEGRAFQVEAGKFLHQLNASVELVQNISSGYNRTLRIGCHCNLLRESFPKILQLFQQKNPDVKVLMINDITDELIVLLENQEIDCMISVYSPEYKILDWLDYKIFMQDHPKLMVSTGHRLAHAGTVSIEQLTGEQIILLRGSDKKNRLLDWADSGNRAKIYCYADNENSIETMVAAGYGVSLCLKSASRVHSGLTYLDITDLPLENLCIAWNNKNRSNLMDESLLPLLLMDQAE